jgi:hypothetical protein
MREPTMSEEWITSLGKEIAARKVIFAVFEDPNRS